MAEESAPGQNGLSLLTCTREVRRRQCTFECTCNQGYCTIGGITSAPVDLENSIEYPMFTRLTSVWCLVTEMIMFHPYDPCMVYLPTCCWFLRTLTIKINQMKVNYTIRGSYGAHDQQTFAIWRMKERPSAASRNKWYWNLNPSSSSSLYIWFTRGLVSLPDILATRRLVPNKKGNWKIRVRPSLGKQMHPIEHKTRNRI